MIPLNRPEIWFARSFIFTTAFLKVLHVASPITEELIEARYQM